MSINLGELIQQTDQPFTAQVTSCPLPVKFQMPQVETYNGPRDPLDHLELFKTFMHLLGVLDEIMCRAFPTTLKGLARVWFSKITLNTISNFKELSGNFIAHFIGRQRYKRSLASLLNIKGREDESLRSYVTRFNKEALLIDEANDMVLVITFTNGLQSEEFLFSVYKNDLKTMADMLYRAMKQVNVEDAMIARGSRPKKREKQDDPYPNKGRKSAQTNDRRDDRRSRPPLGRIANFTLLNTPLDQVLMEIRDDQSLTWPDKLKSDPNKRPRN